MTGIDNIRMTSKNVSTSIDDRPSSAGLLYKEDDGGLKSKTNMGAQVVEDNINLLIVNQLLDDDSKSSNSS